jgi:hypothetical protein
MKFKQIIAFACQSVRAGRLALVSIFCLPIAIGITSYSALGQNIAINTNGDVASASALLEVKSNNKGMLIPRVSLSNTATTLGDHSADAAVPAPANRLVVFNTNATAGNGKGFYYYDSTNATSGQWVYMVAPSNGPGTSGQVLTTNGSGSNPIWSTQSLGTGAGDWTLVAVGNTGPYSDCAGYYTTGWTLSANKETLVIIEAGPAFQGNYIAAMSDDIALFEVVNDKYYDGGSSSDGAVPKYVFYSPVSGRAGMMGPVAANGTWDFVILRGKRKSASTTKVLVSTVVGTSHQIAIDGTGLIWMYDTDCSYDTWCYIFER